MGEDKPSIFCYISGAAGVWKPDKPVCALAEDGELLAVHISSNESWAKRDIGVTNPESHHHKEYREHYPDGYELVWVEGSIRDHPQGGAALDRNHEKYRNGEESPVESQG